MRTPFKIGDKEYKFKKDAIAYYRLILNSYNFGESLSDSHFNDLLDLLDYDYFNYLLEIDSNINSLEASDNETHKVDDNNIDEKITNEDIKVAKVQFNTKCFEVFYSDETSQYISYLMILNNKKYNSESLFYVACRNSIHIDIHRVKQEYFNENSLKGFVKCQETGILSNWSELVVDHRQPNTFSMIVDRFKEINKIDLDVLEYISNDENHIIFKDEKMALECRNYHKQKASLRIVRKECNSSRTGMARIKKMAKDLTVK